MKLFYSNVNISFGMNPFEAETKEEYVEIVKASYKDLYDIDLVDSEITDIEEIKNDN